MKYFCNPLNIPYKYQFNNDLRLKKLKICREAADPSLILFKGKYYIFASMSLGVYVSDDLATWEYVNLNKVIPEVELYNYAPDVRVVGDYVYYSTSSREHKCDFYRTNDIINGPYEKIKGTFKFWDPNLFADDDNKLYFYFGCTNTNPLYGVELNPNTLKPIAPKRGLIYGDPFTKGFERVGANNSLLPEKEEVVEAKYQAFLKKMHVPSFFLPNSIKKLIKGMFTLNPYIEGAWMDKFNGKYYLQYACPGTQYNTYNDSVYISSSPLGNFTLADNNPYSYKPGGFINGAGHGSTLKDKNGELWHVSTMSISINHDFERRIGLFKANIDEQGNLFCNQYFGDYPYSIEELSKDSLAFPKWNLLSYKKTGSCSSYTENHPLINLMDENIKTFWEGKANHDEWVKIDLGNVDNVHAIQINFADNEIKMEAPGKIRGSTSQARYIEERNLFTRYVLEGSLDDQEYFLIVDKSTVTTDLSHDLIVNEAGFKARYIRLKIVEVPYALNPCISGLRVFGINDDMSLPKKSKYQVVRDNDLDAKITIASQNDVTGYNVLFGNDENHLYHSYMTFDNKVIIGALIKNKKYCYRVDTFNEKGITIGNIFYEK